MRQDLQMVRGDTWQFTIKATGDIGSVSNLKMTVRRKDTDAVLFTLSLGSEIIANGNNTWSATIAPSMTAGADIVPYKYDIEFVVGSNHYTPMYGTFTLIEDQTR